jgi:hypothetical protein
VSASATGEVLYEVNIDLDAGIEAAYRAWLRGHVAEILALPGFVDARVFDVVEPAGGGRIGICMQYRLQDEAALQAYLERHAPRLRAEGVARFGDRFAATRRVLRAAR